VNTLAESTRRWVCVVLLSAATILSIGASAASADPNDPTAEECAIIAQNAVTNSTDFQSELAKTGTKCPIPVNVSGVTVKPAGNPVAVKPAAVVAAGTLPKSGSNIGGTLTIAGLACLAGGSLLLVNRKRKALPTPD
jgi:LPXTG-motif cell wall-anchored protein